MTIYIDIVLIENIVMNYIIIFTTGMILKLKINNIRYFISSLLGAIYSVVAYMRVLNIYSSIFLKIILSIVIVYIAYNPQNVKKLWKNILIFYLTSFLFGGTAFALIYIVKPKEILMKNGLFLGTYPLKIIILGTIISFVIIITAFNIIKNKISSKDIFREIKIVINGEEIKVRALVDTGNLLKEPITNTPVIIVEHTLLYKCMPKEILNNIENVIRG